MGFAMSWVAVRGRSLEAICADADLHPTGRTEGFPESRFVGAELPGGWSLLAGNGDTRFFLEKELLARLSRGTEVVACFVEEHIMFSGAAGYEDGHERWHVTHDGINGAGPIVAEGRLPDSFAEIRAQCEEEQRVGDDDVDYTGRPLLVSRTPSRASVTTKGAANRVGRSSRCARNRRGAPSGSACSPAGSAAESIDGSGGARGPKPKMGARRCSTRLGVCASGESVRRARTDR